MPVRVDHSRSDNPEPAVHDDTLVVGFINNMPDGAIRSSEQQFIRLLAAASDGLDVRLRLFEMADMPRSDRARAELLGNYRDVAEMWDSPLDALIVTGSEPRAPSLPQEPYWPTLTRIVDWADANTVSSIWSCLAAHAAVLHTDGIERHAFDAKLSGVFECYKAADHAIVRDAPDRWNVPHSRQYGLRAEDLAANGYTQLTMSSIAGTDIFLKQRNSLFVLFQGHLEYEADSLLREYVRDITRYLNRERDFYPDMPLGFFGTEATRKFLEFRDRALKRPASDELGPVPLDQVQAELVNKWRIPAVSIYRRWLHLIAERKSARTSIRPIEARSASPNILSLKAQ